MIEIELNMICKLKRKIKPKYGMKDDCCVLGQKSFKGWKIRNSLKSPPKNLNFNFK